MFFPVVQHVLAILCRPFTGAFFGKGEFIVAYLLIGVVASLVSLETNALKVFKDFDYKPAETQLSGLKDGIGYWNRGLELIRQPDKLTLSEKTHKKNALLIRYCQLRIQSFQMMSSGIQKGDQAEQGQLQTVNEQIKLVVKKLSE